MGDVVLFGGSGSYFSRNIPSALRYLLHAAKCSDNYQTTEKLLRKARHDWPDEADAHLALYKFYFISGHYKEAEAAAWQALDCAAKLGGFFRNYRRLTPASADWSTLEGPCRWYLFTLKALGVIRLRRAKVADARRVLGKLLELDPSDEIGGGAYLRIAKNC